MIEEAQELARELDVCYWTTTHRVPNETEWHKHPAFTDPNDQPFPLALRVYRTVHDNPGIQFYEMKEMYAPTDEQTLMAAIGQLRALHLITHNNLSRDREQHILTKEGREFYNVLADKFGWDKREPPYDVVPAENATFLVYRENKS